MTNFDINTRNKFKTLQNLRKRVSSLLLCLISQNIQLRVAIECDKNPICFIGSLFMYHITFLKLFLPVYFILSLDYCRDTIPQIYLFIIDLPKFAAFLISMIHCSTPKIST